MIKRLLISSILGVVSVAAQLPEFDLIGFDADRVELAESELLTIDAPASEALAAQEHDFVVLELSGLSSAEYGVEVETDVDGVPAAQSSILNVEDAIGVIDEGVSVFGLSSTLHPLFVNEHSGLWETELGQFVDEPSWDIPALVLPSRVHAVAPHINLVIRDADNLKSRLLQAAEAGANVVIIPYRLGYEIQPVVDILEWSGDHFETVLLGFSANRPWPSPASLRETLDRLAQAGVDGVITAWVSSIDIAGVFAPHQEDTSRFDTWLYMTRWVGSEAVERELPVVGFRKIDVHGTWERPSRAGGLSGGVFDYTPEGLSAYIYAHIHPFDSGMMIPSRHRIETRMDHQDSDKPALIGPFYYFGENPGQGLPTGEQVRRLVRTYSSMGYHVVEKWVR